jgi:diguanylate cyclase (GGDEF)-like protein/PAS domain S-box-containing protein
MLCFLANLATVNAIGRARDAATAARFGWVTVAGIAGGFGIWATHFAAMLAYDPGLSITFDLPLTLVSLAIALVSTWAASFLVVSLPRPQGSLAAGLIFGVGVTCMHFLGMSAIEFGGVVLWSRPLVLAAIAAPVVTAPFAFALSLRNGLKAVVFSALILALGIVAMHFIAMGAATLVPNAAIAAEPGTLSKPLMLAMIVAVSLSLIGSGLAASAIAQRAARSSNATEANFQLLVRGVTDYAIYMLDPDGIVSNWNAGAERAKGYTAAEIVGCNFARFYSAEDQVRGLPQLALQTAREVGRFEAEGKRYRKDGSWFWAHVVIHPILDDEGVLVGYAKITRNITRQKEDTDRIAAVTRNLDLALENMTQGICLFDSEERLILSNARYGEIFGFPEGSIAPGIRYRDMVFRGYHSAFDNREEAESRALQHYSRNIAAIRSGQKIPLHLTAFGRTIRTAFNNLPQGGWVATFEDISEQVRSEEQIAFMARHDTLTQLPNRPALMGYLRDELEVAEQASANVAVVGIDLNKFKQINDQLGHGVGDEVLRTISARLRELARPHELIARFGGDEFVAVKRYTRLSEVQDFLDRLDAAFSSPMEVEAHRLSPGASMGVALYPNDGRSPEALIANADLAMYRAKASLSRSVCFYDVSMDEAARDRAKMAKDLWAAIDQNQVRLHYQVQKSISTGRITGYEVLLRWTHPERGPVAPDEFIGVAEECGAILPLGEWVLREACREAAHWPMDYKVAVNLSPVQIAHVDMPALVESVLRETGLKPSRLELEITESSIISDKQRALNALTAIKALGVSIAMDDFGTGYSSLETLRSFPFDKIKLDRSFMIEVEASDEAKAMVRAVLALGQGLRIPVLAEGVETARQLEILRSEGCHEAQGYLLGRPMPMEDQPLAEVA